MWLYHRVMSPNDADGMANSVDPDQTAPLGAADCSSRSSLIWVCTVCPDLSVRKLRIITVSITLSSKQTTKARRLQQTAQTCRLICTFVHVWLILFSEKVPQNKIFHREPIYRIYIYWHKKETSRFIRFCIFCICKVVSKKKYIQMFPHRLAHIKLQPF